MTKHLTTKAAIEKVLTDSGKPMTVAEITEAALPLTNLKGKTPKQVFYSVLYGENKKKDGVVVKAGKGGTFKLNPKRATASVEAEAKPDPKPATRKPRAARKPKDGTAGPKALAELLP